MIVQVSGTGGVEAVISDIMRDTEALDTQELSINPTIDGAATQRNAIEFLAAQYERLQFEATQPELMIYSPVVVGNSGPPKLVWRTEVANIGEPAVKELILVDAHTGEIAFHYSLISGAMRRVVTDYDPYTVYHDSHYWDPQPETDIEEVDFAAEYLKDTYDFYLQHHGRENWDDNPDTVLQAYVRFSGSPLPGWAPAMWLGGVIYVRAGSVTDDTIGHEFTHGVTDCECNLTGSGESGAIDESFSDMWGEWIDLENRKDRDGNDDDPDDKWYLWEDDESDPPPDDYRYMKDPPEFSWYPADKQREYVDPDRYNHPDFYDGDDDSGGIHHNCGVGNKLAYLLTDGSSEEDNGQFNGETITGLGMPNENELDASDLYYECQCYLLTSSAEYSDLAYALLLAASNLGFTAAEQEDVVRACRAVEIYSGNTAFSIQDSSGVRVAWFDDLGNLFLAGRQLDIDAEIEGHWKLDETSADSVGINNGILNGSPQWVTGKIDGALDFNGTGDYVSLSQIAALSSSSSGVTISAWIKADLASPLPYYIPIVTQSVYERNGTAVAKPLPVLDLRLSEFLS